MEIQIWRLYSNLYHKLQIAILFYEPASTNAWSNPLPSTSFPRTLSAQKTTWNSPIQKTKLSRISGFCCRCIALIYNFRSNEMTVLPSLHTHCLSFSSSFIAVYKFCHSVRLPFITGNITTYVNGRRFPPKVQVVGCPCRYVGDKVLRRNQTKSSFLFNFAISFATDRWFNCCTFIFYGLQHCWMLVWWS